MIMPSAARVSDTLSFARVATSPCESTAGLTDEDYAAGARIHAALLAEARTAVSDLTRTRVHRGAPVVTAFVRSALKGSHDESAVADLACRLMVL